MNQRHEKTRQLWRELHNYAYQYHGDKIPRSGKDYSKLKQWRAKIWIWWWASKLPRDCGCRKEWELILSIQAPPLQTTEALAFWHWTLAAHDFVNVTLGKNLYYHQQTRTHPLVLFATKRKRIGQILAEAFKASK